MKKQYNRGYHYIRYAVFGIYLTFLVKSFDWLNNSDFTLIKQVSWFGVYLTILCVIMDARNQYLWHQDEAPVPGRTSVTWPLYLFYLGSLIWFLSLALGYRS